MEYGAQIRLTISLVLIALSLSGCDSGEGGARADWFSGVRQLFGVPKTIGIALTPQQRELRERRRDYAGNRAIATLEGALSGRESCREQDLTGLELVKCIATAVKAGQYGDPYRILSAGKVSEVTVKMVAADTQRASIETTELQENIKLVQTVVAMDQAEVQRLLASRSSGGLEDELLRARLDVIVQDKDAVAELLVAADKSVKRLQDAVGVYEVLPVGKTELLKSNLRTQLAGRKELQGLEVELAAAINSVLPKLAGRKN